MSVHVAAWINVRGIQNYMTGCEQLAEWAVASVWDQAGRKAKERIKMHLLDSVGCALGALGAEPIKTIRQEQRDARASGHSTQIAGEDTTPERAAFYNGALIRYLDFMDTFVAPGEACHPSDNIAVILAGAELAEASGRDFLTALLVAYQVQCRLTGSGVPIMQSGFDHVLQLSISQAAGLCRVLQIPAKQAAHAIAISATEGLGLAAARAGNPVPQWKGLASAATAFHVIHNTRLAQFGITGPLDVFESALGLERVLGRRFGIHWEREELDAVLLCSIKRYNAEFHSQSSIEALLAIQHEYRIDPGEIVSIEIDIFNVAYEMIGGGKYLDPKSVETKEDADHSLHYLAAVALLDGEVGPDQLERERIQSDDVQQLLQKVTVTSSSRYTRAYPRAMRCKVEIKLRNGRKFTKRVKDYSGFYRSPMSVEDVIVKFQSLATKTVEPHIVRELQQCILGMDRQPVADLIAVLRSIPKLPDTTAELVRVA